MRDATGATQRRILIETTIASERKSVGIAHLLWFFFGVEATTTMSASP